jgi:hypothetical protein
MGTIHTLWLSLAIVNSIQRESGGLMFPMTRRLTNTEADEGSIDGSLPSLVFDSLAAWLGR